MSGYVGINLRDILCDETLGESVAKSILSSFSCPLNPDVEYLKKTRQSNLQNKAYQAPTSLWHHIRRNIFSLDILLLQIRFFA